MTPLIACLEITARMPARARLRRALNGLTRAGLPINWSERAGCWRSVFVVWGHPVLIQRLQRLLTRLATRPAATRGRLLDILA